MMKHLEAEEDILGRVPEVREEEDEPLVVKVRSNLLQVCRDEENLL